MAWGERDPGSVLAAAPGPLAGQLRSLLAALRPVRLPAQLIHGDLGGNVLFAAGEPPAVIDFSPYWRPAGLALAVAAVDALTWSGADPAILDELAGEPELDQLLAHAHVYRLVTEVVFRRGDPDPSAGLETVARTSQPVTVLVLARLALGKDRITRVGEVGTVTEITQPDGARLRLARQARGLSQQQLAGVAGVTRQAVSAVRVPAIPILRYGSRSAWPGRSA